VVRRRKLLRLVRKASDLQGFQLFNRFDALWDLFLDITRHEKKGCINIVIDAIDECSDETQLLLVNRITKLLESGVATPIKIFMTSRPNTTAIYALQESSVEYIRLSLEENQDLIGQDVHLVIQQRLELLARRGSCSPEFCRRLEESLVNKAEGTFLWVSLVLPLLEKRRVLTVSDLLMIQQLPQGLIALYKGFLKDIPIPDRELAGNILRIVVSSARPLNVDEIAILLAGGQASLAKINYPFYNSESIQLMLRPLVRISNSRVELVHQSIKEFLIDLGRDSTSSLAATFGVSFRRESPMLARACMRYLTSDQFAADLFAKDQLTDEECPASPVAAMSAEQSLDDGLNPFGFDLQGDNIFDEEADVESERLISLAERYKLYDYAATHWATHFAQSNDDVGSDLYELTISLCDPSSARFHNWFRYFWVTSGMHESYPTVIDPLVITSFFGHSSTLQQLLKKSHNDGLEYGQALYWATRRGRFSCMEMLISQKRDSIMHNPRCSYVKNQSPLAAASQHGHLQCVQYLLKENMFDFNEQSSRGRTPISLAAGSGHAQILAALLSIEEIDPNLPDGGGSTPLFWAVAANSAQATSRLLDDSRVEPNHLDGNGRNALSWAAADGQYILVGLLLRNPRIDANNRDSKGWTPLIYATQNGHIDVVKLLVQNIRVDPSCKDESGRNAISWASEKRDKKDFILHYLLQHDKGGADAEDKDGWTPLAWAMNPPGYLENVLILLQSGLVDVNHPDHDGRSPLSFAVSYGYLGITQTLVRARAVELNVRDISGRTPLFYAAGYGNLEIAQLLVETKGVDIDPRDNSGRTPLSLAAGAGSLEIVRLLMRTPGVNKNAHDNKGNTPLWYARHSGSDDVVLELSRS
jgi:ankyrin repeat protein